MRAAVGNVCSRSSRTELSKLSWSAINATDRSDDVAEQLPIVSAARARTVQPRSRADGRFHDDLGEK